MKPLILRQVGKKWEVYLNVQGAKAFGAKSPRMKMYAPDAILTVVMSPKGGLDLVEGGKPATFSKEDAMHVAHKIGHYMLGLGSFVYTYVSEIKASAKSPRRRRR